MKTKVEEELNKLRIENIIRKGTHNKCVAPLVVVPNENGKVRLRGNTKVP